MQNDFLLDLFNNALLKIGVKDGFKLFFEEPKNPEHGDLSTNIAMQLAKQLKQAPRKIAELIIDNLEFDNEIIEKIDIAGPGFINVKFKPAYYQRQAALIAEQGEQFGKNNQGKDKKLNIEYVSANPTGLLHLGHGRNACIGDTVANLYEWNGWDVTREYYFNNAGNQMNILGKSVYARYMQLVKDPDFPFPEDGYHGDYVKDIAAEIRDEYGDKLTAGSEKELEICREKAEQWCFNKIDKTVFFGLIPNYISLFHQKQNTTQLEILRNLKVSLSLPFSVSSFSVNDYLDAKRHSGYRRFPVLLDDFSVPNFLDGLPQVFSARWLIVCHLILHYSPQMIDWVDIWAVPGPFQYIYLVIFKRSVTTADQ